MKTPIAYYGGKILMSRHIIPLIPKHSIYTEAFFGGGAVFFKKEKVRSETINDSNSMVVCFYEVCQTNFEELQTKIKATPYSRDIYKRAYTIYQIPHLFEKVERAWAFFVCTNMGYNHQIRTWAYDKMSNTTHAFVNKQEQFDERVYERLKGVQIENTDANRVILSRDTKDSFHYVDPPYIHTNQGHYKGYDTQDFIKLLETLSSIKGKFILSSFPSEILDEYCHQNKWHQQQFDKVVSSQKVALGTTKRRKIEVLTANYTL